MYKRQHLLGSRSAALLGVSLQMSHQRRRHRLPPHRFAFLPESDQTLLRSQIHRTQSESSAAPARRLGMQTQQHIQFRVVARGGLICASRSLPTAARILGNRRGLATDVYKRQEILGGVTPARCITRALLSERAGTEARWCSSVRHHGREHRSQ